MKDLKILLTIFLLATLSSLLLFWPIFTGKVNLNGNLLVSFYAPYGENLPYKNSGWDQLRIYFPFYKVTLEALQNFEVPLWNPWAFSGHPQMADFQSAVFYPLSIFGLFLPQIEFWHLMRVAPTVLAALFTFLYLRSLKLATLACIFGALVFGFSPFILTWGEEVVMSPHSIVWLPLVLFGIEKYLQSRKKLFLVTIVLSVAFSFFGGYMQTSIYMFIFIFFYLLLRARRKLFSSFYGWRLIGAFFLGAGIAAVQLLPSAELFFNAARSEVALKEQLFGWLLPVESLITYLAPDFFGHPATHNLFRSGNAQYYEGIMFVGVGALIFALHSLKLRMASPRDHWAGLSRFFVISGVLALLTTIDWFGARLFLSLPIPFLSTSIPNRVLFIPAFCLSIMAARGFDRWFVTKDLNIFKSVLFIAGAYGGILAVLVLVKILGISYFEHKQFTTDGNWLVSARNLMIPIALFVATVTILVVNVYGRIGKQTAGVLIIVISFLHIFYFSQKYFSFSTRDKVFPKSPILTFLVENQGIYRSWGVGEAFLENNFASQYSLFWPEGYDSLNNRSYGEFTYAMQGNKIDIFTFRADAGLGRGKTTEQVENPARRRLIDMVGVRYVIAKTDDGDVLERNNFEKVFEEGKYAIFENQTVMPRVFLASNYEGPPDVFGEESKTEAQRIQREKERRKLIPEKLLGKAFDWRNVIILEKPSPISAQFGPGTAEVASYKPTEVVVKTQSQEPKILFLSDNWYPGWRVTVDGDETEILRANYTFRAVPLIAGEHEVRFYYESNTFKLGLFISLVSLFGLGLLLLMEIVKKQA